MLSKGLSLCSAFLHVSCISTCVLHISTCTLHLYMWPAYLYLCPASLHVSCISECALHLHLCFAPLHASCICTCVLHLYVCPESYICPAFLYMCPVYLYMFYVSLHVLCERMRDLFMLWCFPPAADWTGCLLWAWRCFLYYHHQTTTVCEIRHFTYEKSMEFWLLFKILLTRD